MISHGKLEPHDDMSIRLQKIIRPLEKMATSGTRRRADIDTSEIVRVGIYLAGILLSSTNEIRHDLTTTPRHIRECKLGAHSTSLLFLAPDAAFGPDGT